VSTAQLSRLEADQVTRPSLETLLALAPALNFHPTPLLVLGRQLDGDKARYELQRLFKKSADTIVAEYGKQELKTLSSRLERADEDELLELATYALTLPVAEVDWPHGLATAASSNAPDGDLLNEVTEAWSDLTPDRRWRLVQLVRDLRQVSRSESQHPTSVRSRPKETP
jgi:transcriptional regulator with XRE-family HTH domain